MAKKWGDGGPPVVIKTTPPVVEVEEEVTRVIALVTEGPPGEPGPRGPAGPAGSAYWNQIIIIGPATYDVLPDPMQQIEVDAALGPVTINLPDAAEMEGYDLRVIKIDDSTNLISVVCFAGQTIRRLPSFDDLKYQDECLQINARTDLWRIV